MTLQQTHQSLSRTSHLSRGNFNRAYVFDNARRRFATDNRGVPARQRAANKEPPRDKASAAAAATSGENIQPVRKPLQLFPSRAPIRTVPPHIPRPPYVLGMSGARNTCLHKSK